MRALLLTNHLFEWAGSETLIHEISEELISRGENVTVFCNDIDRKFRKKFQCPGLTVVSNPDEIRVEDFDLIYCQHQVLIRFLDQMLEMDGAGGPIMVFAHLSPYEPLEFPGAGIELAFADLILGNSAETRAKLIELGVPEPRLSIYPNPAPRAFFEIPPRSGSFRRLLAVSNHFPKEALAAFELLERSGVEVTRVGREFVNRRIHPADIAEHDAVFSIGKSIQYALAARRPAFVYDRFGGPGWLTPSNVERASEFNFSGRCCNRNLVPDALLKEVSGGFDAAVRALPELEPTRLGYRLPDHLDRIVSLARLLRADLPRRCDVGASRSELAAFDREFHQHQSLIAYRGSARRYRAHLEVIGSSPYLRLQLWLWSRMGRRKLRRIRSRLFRAVVAK